MVIAMIESPEGLAAVEEIAAVPGVMRPIHRRLPEIIDAQKLN
jgi:hypothetical protein